MGLLLALAVWATVTRIDAAPRPAPPPPARAAGYLTDTFSTVSDFGGASVDLSDSPRRGFPWYVWNFFGPPLPPGDVTFNPDGTITLSGGYANGTIASAAKIAGAPRFVGTAFAGGGYFEAELAFDPRQVDQARGWPAWWAMALEHLVGLPGEQWGRQASGYSHFIETDIFEDDIKDGRHDAYGATLHDWYGANHRTCPKLCNVQTRYAALKRPVDPATDWTRFHRLGMLWIAATPTRRGAFSFYFDGTKVGPTTSYAAFQDQAPPPSLFAPWTFGIIDRQHLVLILGSNSGPMRVRSVNVWQASGAKNLVN